MRLRLVLVSCVVSVLLVAPVSAIVCQKKKSGVLRVAAACKRNEVPFEGALGPVGPVGPSGAAGMPGAGGELRVYGDGSAGALTTDLLTSLDDVTLEFTDFTIPTGMSVFVGSGTIIRCTGTFTNNGTLFVGDGTEGARFFVPNTNSISLASRGAHPGNSRGAAMNGERAMGVSSNPGAGGTALDTRQARRLLAPGAFGGGGGGYGTSSGGNGGTGGGSLTILAATAIVNNGVIDANARSQQSYGAGGGAGGVIIAGSRGSISNNGILRADGSEGGDSLSDGAAGAGGGGGIVHLLAPVINAVGSVSVAGGPPGAQGAPGSVSAPIRHGGGGGGACGGNGGQGGIVNNSNPGAASAGEPGQSFESLVDPTSLF